MKRILFLLALAISSFCMAQNKMSEQRAMKESHIDFNKEYLFFTIHGLIEIDGHIFKNDTCKSPIQFQANLDGITIIDTLNYRFYEHRKCGKNGCNIIHLSEINGAFKLTSPFSKPEFYFRSDGELRNYSKDSTIWKPYNIIGL